MNKQDTVQQIIGSKANGNKKTGSAFAPANIALCKYWGKRNEELNLPLTDSLSVSLASLGAKTTVGINDTCDRFTLNGKTLSPDAQAAKRVFHYLDLFRPSEGVYFNVESDSTIPIAAGLASSASGFAALAMALNDLFMWDLDRPSLSILARLGSGSACRSVYEGFTVWNAGTRADGMDSHAEAIDEIWPEFRLGLIMISDQIKPVSSRDAMRQTVGTSKLYKSWPEKVAADMQSLRIAIRDKDFTLLGQTAESNALSMHATMIDSQPPVLYWLPESVAAMKKIWALRKNGCNVYFTMDAGPNLKALFLAEDANQIQQTFPSMEIVAPFAN